MIWARQPPSERPCATTIGIYTPMSISTTHLNVLFHRAPLIVPSVLHPTSLKGSMPTLWLVVIGVFTLLFALVQARKKKNGALPPGPKPLPIVGNVLDLTARELWVRATQWAKSYGESLRFPPAISSPTVPAQATWYIFMSSDKASFS